MNHAKHLNRHELVLAVDADLKEQGFDRIGRIDDAGRRSLWLKIEFGESGQEGRYDTYDAFVLRAGREGDDIEVRVTRDNPQFRELLEAMERARYAAEWEDPRGSALDPEEPACRSSDIPEEPIR